jgi:hypothetical protein
MKDPIVKHDAVKCLVCSKLHAIDSEDFVSVHGNICIGLGGGEVGNNLDETGRVASVSIYCRTDRCLQVFDRLKPKPVTRDMKF